MLEATDISGKNCFQAISKLSMLKNTRRKLVKLDNQIIH